jgi:cytochrome c oxidase assembly protein subunit 11
VTNDANTRTALKAAGVVLMMGSLAWASVPLYDWFCRTTGFGGVTQSSDTASDIILDQTMKVRFDASLERGMPWEFQPVVREVEIKIGETGLAFYEAYNPTNRPVMGTASYNVTPFDVGAYFTKIACFCFEEQLLAPGERLQMPVTFYIDPEIVNDRDAKYAKVITLSYTFYETDAPEEAAALADDNEISFN